MDHYWPRTRFGQIEPDRALVPWSIWPWHRCKARSGWGHRCDLRKGHEGPHVSSRGFDEYEFYDLTEDVS